MGNEKIKILLFFKKAIIGDIYSLALEECIKNCTAVGLKSISDILTNLEDSSSAALVTDYEIDGTELKKLGNSKFLLEMNVPIFLFSDEQKIPEWAQSHNIHILAKKSMPTELVDKLQNEASMAKSLAQYCRVPVKSLLKMSSGLHSDVYVKISESKYIKMANANELLDVARLEKFLSQGIEQLYMVRADFLRTIDKMIADVGVMIANPEKVTLEAAVGATKVIFDAVHAAFEVEGFTPQVKVLAEASIQLAVQAIKKNPKLSEILDALNTEKTPYIAWHSNALAFMSCKLATLLNWDSESTFFKLSMAAMLHDMAISEDRLAMLNTLDAIKLENLSESQHNEIVNHPTEAAKLVASFAELPGEVSFIISQHHELPDGSGFPNHLSQKDVSAISALFIISHRIVDAMYEEQGAFNFEYQLRKLEKLEIFNKGSYGQVFRAISHKYVELF